MKVIAGLGNPGRDYERTRHNVGFDVVQRLRARARVEDEGRDRDLAWCQVSFDTSPVLLAMPLAYMNRSGPPLVRRSSPNTPRRPRKVNSAT